jgi:hypothetical protein
MLGCDAANVSQDWTDLFETGVEVSSTNPIKKPNNPCSGRYFHFAYGVCVSVMNAERTREKRAIL